MSTEFIPEQQNSFEADRQVLIGLINNASRLRYEHSLKDGSISYCLIKDQTAKAWALFVNHFQKTYQYVYLDLQGNYNASAPIEFKDTDRIPIMADRMHIERFIKAFPAKNSFDEELLRTFLAA